MTRALSALHEFLQKEAAGGLVLMAAAALALIAANSPLAHTYFETFELHLGPFSLLHWINDGLMTLFFLLVALEIKREMIEGQLSTWPRRLLPGIAALGGMIAPALVYIAFNRNGALNGWAVPTATDIAFALGVLSLLGPRVPVSLKIFLTALAIIDDLGAVAIIALFYTEHLSLAWLGGCALIMAGLAVLNKFKVKTLAFYLLPGVLLWACALQSGIHASLAGVALALFIPLHGNDVNDDSPLHRLEHALHPLVTFAVLPLFGFANAGVALTGLGMETLTHPVALGIALGLFAGKAIGVFGATLLAVKLKLAPPPEDASTIQILGLSILCGIGFTMSLFIGLLAFPGAHDLESAVKLGVLGGSLLSAITGIAVLKFASK